MTQDSLRSQFEAFCLEQGIELDIDPEQLESAYEHFVHSLSFNRPRSSPIASRAAKRRSLGSPMESWTIEKQELEQETKGLRLTIQELQEELSQKALSLSHALADQIESEQLAGELNLQLAEMKNQLNIFQRENKALLLEKQDLQDKNETLLLELERLKASFKETSVSDISIQTETFHLRATTTQTTIQSPNIPDIQEPSLSNINVPQSLPLIQPQIIPKIMTIYRSYSQYLRYHIVLVGLKTLRNDTLLILSAFKSKNDTQASNFSIFQKMKEKAQRLEITEPLTEREKWAWSFIFILLLSLIQAMRVSYWQESIPM